MCTPKYPSIALLVSFLALISLWAAPSAEAQSIPVSGTGAPSVLWTVNTNTFLESAPSLADVNSDGIQEIILAGREDLIAMDGQGKELWKWRAKGRFMTYPAILERIGQLALIYAADASGNMCCVDGSGKPVWEAKLNAPTDWSASVVSDLSGLGRPCVIQTDKNGTVWAFDAVSGTVLWQVAVKGVPVSPAVGDVDDDGKAEIVVATGAGRLVLLGSDGVVRWDIGIGGQSLSWATSAPIIYASSSGAVHILAASSSGEIWCVDRNGKAEWRYATQVPIASGLSVGRTESGEARLYATTQTGVIYQFSETGDVLWNIDMQGRCLAAGALVDINGDGVLEYLVSTQTGRVLILDSTGAFVFDQQMDWRTINVTPAVGDICPDSPGAEMVLTGGESGKVVCFSLPGTPKGNAPWTQYRGDARKTGAWLALKDSGTVQIKPENLTAADLLPGQVLGFTVCNPNPGPQPLKATVTRKGPGRDEMQTVTSVVLGKRSRLTMPLNAIGAGNVEFSWSVAAPDGKVLYSDRRVMPFQPFAAARDLLKNTAEAAESAGTRAARRLPLSAAALRTASVRLNADAATVPPLRVPGKDEAIIPAKLEDLGPAAAIVAGAKRLTRLSAIVRQAASLGSDSSVVAFETSTWENRGVEDQLPERIFNPATTSRRMVPGEHEPVSFGLLNVTDRELVVRVIIDAPEGAPKLVLHRSIGIPTSLGETSWDPLPELDDSRTITIPSLGVRELWMDADATGCKPGNYPIKIVLQALNGAGVLEGPTNPQAVAPPLTTIVLNTKILPFEMASSGAVRLCAWATYSPAVIRDLLAHGNNVFVAPISEPVYDAQGALTGFDHAKLDAFAEQLRGKDVILLPQGIPAIRGDKTSPEYAAGIAKFTEDVVNCLAAKGFGTDQFAFYPVDEPGGAGWNAVNTLVEFAKLVQVANPKVRVYVDGGGDPPMFEAMKPYVTIWTPGINQLAEKSPEMEIMRSCGDLWSYNCGYPYARPIGVNLKNINLVAEFRLAAPFVFRHNATGLGFWCYNVGEDNWPRIEMEYPLVYPGGSAPVPSRRWEGVREGVEDFRILAALRRKMGDGSGTGDDAQARIKHLIEVSLPTLLDQSYEEMRRGLGRDVIDATNNDRTVNALRQEMLDCIEALN